MKYQILLFLILFTKVSFAQRTEDLKLQIGLLATYKRNFEKYDFYSLTSTTSKYVEKRDSVERLYDNQIKKIKSSPNTYLTFLNTMIVSKDPALDSLMFYGFIDTRMPFNKNDFAVSRRNFYRIVKFSLFDKKMNRLPKTLKEIKLNGIMNND